MTVQLSDHFLLGHIPYLYRSRVRAHIEIVSSAAPANRSNGVIGAHIVQLLDLVATGRPDIHCAGEAHRQVVVLGPVNEVQVEVVLEVGGVKDLVRQFGDFTLLFLRNNHLLFIKPIEGTGLECVREAWHRV